MNVFEKLNEARLRFQNANAKPDKAEELITLIKPYMATMSDEQLDYTNKAISERNVSKLFTILNKCEKPNN